MPGELTVQAQLTPLFSSPLLVLDGVPQLEIAEAVSRFTYGHADEGARGNCTEISEDRHVLRDFPRDEAVIMSLFEHYKSGVMRYDGAEFRMTTSWLTRASKGTSSNLHIHRNSVYTGVAFLSDGGAKLMLDWSLHAPGCMSLGQPSEWNVYNSTGWSVEPREGRVVFFPSHVPHQIGRHDSEELRYSLAFNIFPVGSFGGDYDSNITVQVH